MSTSINNVINVALLPEGRLAGRDNANVVAIITSSQEGPLSSGQRYKQYSSPAEVAEDWGSLSPVYQHALALFGTRPNPTNVGGAFLVGYWRASSEDVPASAARLSGAELNQAALIGQVQGISDGAFSVEIDGVAVPVTGLDFTTAVTLDDVAELIDGALDADGSASIEGGRLVITSPTTGAGSTITLASPPAGGTDVSSVLMLSAGTGAAAIDGQEASTLPAETMVEAATALKAAVNVKGMSFIDGGTSADALALAQWAQGNSVLVYDVFSDPGNLEVDAANVVWQITRAGLSNYRMLYSAAGNRLFATAYMARTHTVNFNGENTAITMHLKELPIAPEDYSQADITAAKRVGLDIYTSIKDAPVVLTSGANDFVDNPYNLMAYVDAVQTDMFNLLKGTATKIPQTLRGTGQMVDAAEKTTRGFVRAGVFAPGAWSSPDTFGDFDTFMRAIETAGFYVVIGSLADQPQADRQERLAPVMQIAVKNSGAIHNADIIINFNR